MTYKAYSTTLVPSSYKQPHLVLFYSDWCFSCAQVYLHQIQRGYVSIRIQGGYRSIIIQGRYRFIILQVGYWSIIIQGGYWPIIIQGNTDPFFIRRIWFSFLRGLIRIRFFIGRIHLFRKDQWSASKIWLILTIG